MERGRGREEGRKNYVCGATTVFYIEVLGENAGEQQHQHFNFQKQSYHFMLGHHPFIFQKEFEPPWPKLIPFVEKKMLSNWD